MSIFASKLHRHISEETALEGKLLLPQEGCLLPFVRTDTQCRADVGTCRTSLMCSSCDSSFWVCMVLSHATHWIMLWKGWIWRAELAWQKNKAPAVFISSYHIHLSAFLTLFCLFPFCLSSINAFLPQADVTEQLLPQEISTYIFCCHLSPKMLMMLIAMRRMIDFISA